MAAPTALVPQTAPLLGPPVVSSDHLSQSLTGCIVIEQTGKAFPPRNPRRTFGRKWAERRPRRAEVWSCGSWCGCSCGLAAGRGGVGCAGPALVGWRSAARRLSPPGGLWLLPQPRHQTRGLPPLSSGDAFCSHRVRRAARGRDAVL